MQPKGPVNHPSTTAVLCQKHKWLLPSALARAKDMTKLFSGRCQRCGYCEMRTGDDWLKELELIMERLMAEKVVN